MQVFQWHEIISLAVEKVGKPAAYINNGFDFDTPEDGAAWEVVTDHVRKMFGERTKDYYDVIGACLYGGLVFFETENELNEFYRVFESPALDSSAMYVATYNAMGHCQTENT